jgi:hypothetical protein
MPGLDISGRISPSGHKRWSLVESQTPTEDPERAQLSSGEIQTNPEAFAYGNN